jgi:hypothetical protein
MNLSKKTGVKGAQKLCSWEDSYDMFINFISVENLSKWPAYLRHAEKIDG